MKFSIAPKPILELEYLNLFEDKNCSHAGTRLETNLYNGPDGNEGITSPENSSGAVKKRGPVRRTCTFCLASVLVVVLGIALLGTGMYFFSKPSRESAKAFIDTEVVPALKEQNPISLAKLSTSELASDLQTSKSDQLFMTLRDRLGPIQSLDDNASKFQINWNLNGRQFYYATKAIFEKSYGTLTLTLQKVDDDWKLFGFNIHSTDLLP